jgi:phospholipid/cholesterol/gamma-HCH transport system substrate-binding protein
MSKPRTGIKVGFFVALTLILIAVLLLQFSKGNTLLRKTYTVILKTSNVGGLRNKASVLLSGVQVGTVSAIKLSPEGTNVSVYLKLYSEYKLRDSARFNIEQSGFLGDQFVAIYPGDNKGDLLTNLSVATAQEPFNLLEVARSAAGFIKRIDQTAKNLDDAISDVRRDVLNEQTLTNLSFTIATLRQASQDALVTIDNVNMVIKSNGVPVGVAVSNLVDFSGELTNFVQSAKSILNTNEPQISATLSNLEASSATLTNLLNGVQQGKGLAGTIFESQGVAENVSNLTANLAVTSSNLNRYGLWHLLFHKEKPAQTNASTAKSSSR